MNRYGQQLTWGTISAPHAFTGVCTSYSEAAVNTRQLEPDEAQDHAALILHSPKTNINFEARITNGSTDFLDITNGQLVAVDGLTGTLLVARCWERWALGQPKTAGCAIVKYDDFPSTTSPAEATTLDAFTPAAQSLTIVTPDAVLVYGTKGITHGSGVVHEVYCEQSVTIDEDEPSPDGLIKGCATYGYMRTIRVQLLATGAAPTRGATLTLSGAPSHATGYKIENVEKMYRPRKGMMYSVSGIWIPPMAGA